MLSRLLGFGLVTLLTTPLFSATISLVPLAPRGQHAGSPLQLTIVLSNDTEAFETQGIPASLEVRWPGRTSSFRPPENLRNNSVHIPPAQFKKITYSGTVPDDLAGDVTISVTAPELGAFKIDLTILPALPRESTHARTIPEPTILPSVRYESRIAQATRRFDSHEPIYFANGPREGGTTSRFQLSFKYRLGDDWLKNFYFTHTTLSVWDHFKHSGPFRDISHMPGLTWHLPHLVQREGVEFDLWFGYEHESNGRGLNIAKRDLPPDYQPSESDSRSTNRAYFRPVVRFGGPEADLRLFVAPKISKNIKIARENEDLVSYRGKVDWVLTTVLLDACAITGTLRNGSEGWSAQMDFAIRLSKRDALPLVRALPLFPRWKPPGWLLVQYFEGHGETFLEYQRKTSQWRFGYMLTPWFDARARDIDGR